MSVTVQPAEFTMVNFDSARVQAITEDLLDRLGFAAGTEVVVEVDERVPTGGLELHGLDPIHLFAESGALEDPQHVRALSEEGCFESLGRLLIEAADRADPDFGGPALDDDVSLPHRVAWDISIVGRLTRAGGRVQRQRRVYQFRHRHGFSDLSDDSFSTLWESDGLTWAQITDLSDRARSDSAA